MVINFAFGANNETKIEANTCQNLTKLSYKNQLINIKKLDKPIKTTNLLDIALSKFIC